MTRKRYLKDYSRREIQNFVMTYCYSPLYSSLEECAQAYNLSVNMAKEFIYASISKCIVEDDAVDILRRRSYESAMKHAYQDGVHLAPKSSYRKYSNLNLERKLFQFSDAEALEIALMYAVSPLCKSDFCSKNAMTKSILDQTLKRAIVENLISDDLVTDLQSKALSFTSDAKIVNTFFEKLWKQREQNKNKENN